MTLRDAGAAMVVVGRYRKSDRNTGWQHAVAGFMDDTIREALEAGGIADITTTGRQSGVPRRKEIFFHTFDGEHYIGGRPGFKRDWLANLVANPHFTLHLKRGLTADLDAVAEPIRDPDERGTILYRMLTENWGTDPARARADLDRWVNSAPLVRFEVEDS